MHNVYIWTLFVLQKTEQVCVLRSIRIYAEDVYPRYYQTHTKYYRTIFPLLKNFVLTFKRCFIFKFSFFLY